MQQNYRKHWTVGACVSATGEHIPPVFVFQGEGKDIDDALRVEILKTAPKDCVLYVSGTIHPLNFCIALHSPHVQL